MEQWLCSVPPLAHEDHAQRAWLAAIRIRIETYGNDRNAQQGIDCRMRVGLSSGPVVAGSIGDCLRMDYTAKGRGEMK